MNLVIAIVLASFSCSQLTGNSTLPNFLEIVQLSEMLLVPPNRLIFELGSPEAVFLEGADSEGPPTPQDGLELRYSIILRVGKHYPATAWFHLDGQSFLVRGIHLDFPGAKPELAELELAAGGPKRLVEHVVIWDEGELDGWLSKCHHSGGPIQSWVFQDLGLQIRLEDSIGSEKSAVGGISFVAEIKSGDRSFPPCKE